MFTWMLYSSMSTRIPLECIRPRAPPRGAQAPGCLSFVIMGKFGQQPSSIVQVATTTEDARLGTETQALRTQAPASPSQAQEQSRMQRIRNDDDEEACCCCVMLAAFCCCFAVSGRN